MREKYRLCVANGICVRCGKAPAKENSTMCQTCATIVAKQQRWNKKAEVMRRFGYEVSKYEYDND